jgi:AraC-like DNA-binding protein
MTHTAHFFLDSAMEVKEVLILKGIFDEMLQSEHKEELEAFWDMHKIKLGAIRERARHLEVNDSEGDSPGEGAFTGDFGFLEANMEKAAVQSSFAYLPAPKERENLLYPIFISRWHMPSTHFTKRSGWKCYQLIYTHAGAGTLNLNHQIYQLKPNSLCLLDCRTYHYFYAAAPEGWEYSFVHFVGNSADYLCERIKKSGILYSNLKHTVIQKRYDALLSFAEKNPDVADISFHSYLTSLLAEMACFKPTRPEMVVPAWLSEVQIYILENYNEEWNIHDLAERSFLSDSRFAHAFKEMMGCTPMEYRDYLRIEHAKEYLRNTDFSIEQICSLTGFANMSNFYAKFGRQTNTTPAKYRKRN